MSYAGAESFKEDAPQIKNARFVIWDRETGKAMAQSPELHISTTTIRPLDMNPWSTRNYLRPAIFFSQAGNAVVVTGYLAEPVDVYALK